MNTMHLHPKGNLFYPQKPMIQLNVKKLKNARVIATVLALIAFISIFSISNAISGLINDVTIQCTGRVATTTALTGEHNSETRGVFVHCATFGGTTDWNTIAQTCKSYGINMIAAEMASLQACYYSSSLLPHHGVDQLAAAIPACHANGLELHGAMDVLYYPTNTDLAAVRPDGSYWHDGIGYWGCPIRAHDFIIAVGEELVTNYDIDGFMFDYIRYAEMGMDMCYCNDCRAAFQAWLGETIMDWTPFYPSGARHNEYVEWRVTPVTELVRDMRQAMLAIKPDLKFSIAAWTIYGNNPAVQRYWYGQDTADYVAKGYLDLVAPMMYTTDLAALQSYIQQDTNYMVGGLEGKVPLIAFITTGIAHAIPPATFKNVVDTLRGAGADGFIIWRYGGPGETMGLIDITPYLSLLDMPNTFSLSNITADNIIETSARISWGTDLLATSKVEYSTSPLFTASHYPPGVQGIGYWDVDHVLGTLVENLTLATEHSLLLTDLLPDTMYYFRVQSEGPGGIATSKVLTFTTG